MQIGEKVHQIRIDFNVTKEIKRYVYVYLITGKKCYLVDTGVAGSERQIKEYMNTIGRDLSEVAGIFLTHSHPDHLGAAAAIVRASRCKIYAPVEEKNWIEDVTIQFTERPIPNFDKLLQESVKIDHFYQEEEILSLEEDIHMKVYKTPGHSTGSTSFLFLEENVLFCGDAIPSPTDIPIFVSEKESENSLNRIRQLAELKLICPAWDRVYQEGEQKDIIEQSLHFLQKLKDTAIHVRKENEDMEMEGLTVLIAEELGLCKLLGNPLFKKSISSCLDYDIL